MAARNDEPEGGGSGVAARTRVRAGLGRGPGPGRDATNMGDLNGNHSEEEWCATALQQQPMTF